MRWGGSAAALGLAVLTGCGGTVPDSGGGAAQPAAALAAERRSDSGGGFLAALRGPNAETALPRGNAAPSVPLASVSLGGGDVVLKAQQGYCIDPATLETGRSQSFAVLASCRILSNGRNGDPVPPMLMTVTVGPRQPGAEAPDPQHIADELGVPLLAGTGAGEIMLAHLDGGGDLALDNGDARHWRAATVINQRLVGLALYAPAASALAGPGGEGLITGFARALRQDSPDSTRQTGPALSGLLGRLLDR